MLADGDQGKRAWAPAVRDLLLIVVSILIAFSLDAWWDRLTQHSRLQQGLDAVAAEFVTNRAVADSILRGNTEAGRWSAANGFGDLFPDSLSPQLSLDDARGFFTLGTFEPVDGAIQAFLRGDQLSEIRDLELQATLAAWPSKLEDFREDQAAVYDSYLLILNHMAEAGLINRFLVGIAIPYDGQLPLDGSVIRDDETLRGYLTVHSLHLLSANRDLGRLIEEIDRLLALIRQAS